jgi:hypothetical protein
MADSLTMRVLSLTMRGLSLTMRGLSLAMRVRLPSGATGRLDRR